MGGSGPPNWHVSRGPAWVLAVSGTCGLAPPTPVLPPPHTQLWAAAGKDGLRLGRHGWGGTGHPVGLPFQPALPLALQAEQVALDNARHHSAF